MEQLIADTGTVRVVRPGRLLTDAMSSARLQLVEDATKPGKVIVRGEFARSDTATENKRVYPSEIWERELGKLEKGINERKLLGELDHPNDGRTMLSRASHLITGLKFENGVIVGEAEVMDTSKGLDLKALLKAGARVGVSSRGYGSTKSNNNGEEVVQEDYQLVTFDFVAEPADSHAYPQAFTESKERLMAGKDEREQDQAKAEEWAKMIEKARREGSEQTEGTLREEFARELLAKLAEARKEITEQVRAELMSDPSVAGARMALEQVRGLLLPFLLPGDQKTVVEAKDVEISRLGTQLKERELRIKGLEEENSQLAELAKEAGYKFFLERSIACDPEASLVRKSVGDVKRFAKVEDLRLKVESIQGELRKRRDDAKKAEEKKLQVVEESKKAKEQELSRSMKAESVTAGKVAKLETALEKSLALNKEMGIQLYAERRLVNHPHAAKIRGILESTAPDSREAVDEIINKFRVPVRTPDELEEVRSRVRSRTRGGLNPTPTDEETPRPGRARGGDSDYNGLGQDLTEMRELAGIPPQSANKR